MKKKTSPQLLAESLLELAEHKSIEKITVKEIVENCGLSNQTFYNHFTDKYALILWVHKSEGDKILQRYEEEESYTFRDLAVDNLSFYGGHASFMLNALSNTFGQDSYMVQSSENAITVLTESIRRRFDVELDERERVHLRMFIYANTEIYRDWVDNGMTVPVEEMADYIMEAMPESIRKYLS